MRRTQPRMVKAKKITQWRCKKALTDRKEGIKIWTGRLKNISTKQKGDNNG